jgi:hypothetical protein
MRTDKRGATVVVVAATLAVVLARAFATVVSSSPEHATAPSSSAARSAVVARRIPALWTTPGAVRRPGPTLHGMCRNITELRGLEPAVTEEEIEAAARQYVRKVSGITRPTGAAIEPFEAAVTEVAAVTSRLIAAMPARRQPPKTLPPLRRPEVRARLGLSPLSA